MRLALLPVASISPCRLLLGAALGLAWLQARVRGSAQHAQAMAGALLRRLARSPLIMVTVRVITTMSMASWWLQAAQRMSRRTSARAVAAARQVRQQVLANHVMTMATMAKLMLMMTMPAAAAMWTGQQPLLRYLLASTLTCEAAHATASSAAPQRRWASTLCSTSMAALEAALLAVQGRVVVQGPCLLSRRPCSCGIFRRNPRLWSRQRRLCRRPAAAGSLLILHPLPLQAVLQQVHPLPHRRLARLQAVQALSLCPQLPT